MSGVEIEDTNMIPRVLLNLNDLEGHVDIGILGSASSELLEIANAHEFGTTIKPKNKKWLTLPLRKELKGRKATDFKLEFLIPEESGGKYALLVKRDGKEITPYYLLLKKVVIPERAFLRSSIDSPQALQRVEKVLERFLMNAFSGVVSGSSQVLAGMGEEIVSLIKERINNSEFAKNSPLTINLKGGKPPLYDTGRLRDAITYKVNGNE